MRDVESALKEMQGKNVIISYTIEKSLDATQRNKLIDAILTITPPPNFSNVVIAANTRKGRIEKAILTKPNM